MKNSSLRALCGLVFFIPCWIHAETIGDALAKCQSQADSLKRLVCYDDVAKRLDHYTDADREVQSHPATSSDEEARAGAAASTSDKREPALPETKPAVSAASAFGAPQRQAEEVDRIDAKILALSEAPRGELIITLDNDMVWRQVNAAAGVKLSLGQNVYVERGMLGSFYLSYEDVNRRMKVKRIK